MNTFKTNKGITLVALIITIIVLLILTVVAISSITDQGLFTKSQEAVNSYEDSRKEEEGKLAGYASEIDKYLNQQTDKTYVGIIGAQEFILILTPNNEMTLTVDGTVLANKIKPEEIPAPEGFPNSENYSKFYKGTIAGAERICGMSKDGKTVTIVGMGDLILQEEPIVASQWTTYGTDTQYYLVGTNVAYFIYEGDIFTTFTVETGTLEDSDEYGSYTIPSYLQNASKVLKSSEGRIAAVIMSDKSFYTIGLGMDRIQATRLNLNNGINYSEILNKIENPT